MKSESHLEMHADHHQWQTDREFWRDEVHIWDEELAQAIADFQKVESGLRQHQDALNSHLAAITAEAQSPGSHEHELVEYEQGEAGVPLLALIRPTSCLRDSS